MTRIDEALRRAADRPGSPAMPPRQAHFVSAWADAAPAHESAPVRDAVPAAQPVIKPAEPILVEENDPILPGLRTAWGERLAWSPDCDPLLVEEFRRLAGTLHKAQAASGIRTVMITSAVPADGKTLTAINLAIVLSHSYNKRVLLLDADLRRPSIGELTGKIRGSGLSDALKAPADQKLALIALTPTLSLLPSGPPDPDPIAGLTSGRMRQILSEAAALFDWVIIDGPPVEPLADANLLAEIVDGMIFVVRAGTTQFPVVQRALDAVGRECVLGIVLNGVESRGQVYGGYYPAGVNL